MWSWWKSFPICRLPFCPLGSFFCLTEAFRFHEVHLLIANLSAYDSDALFRKMSPVPMRSRLLTTFSSIRFSVFSFMLRSLIHLDLSFVQGDKYGSICILLHVVIQLDQHHLFKMLFSPLYNFCFSVKNQVFIGVRIYVWVFDLIPLVHVYFYANTMRFLLL